MRPKCAWCRGPERRLRRLAYRPRGRGRQLAEADHTATVARHPGHGQTKGAAELEQHRARGSARPGFADPVEQRSAAQIVGEARRAEAFVGGHPRRQGHRLVARATGHASGADLADDCVAVGQRLPKPPLKAQPYRRRSVDSRHPKAPSMRSRSRRGPAPARARGAAGPVVAADPLAPLGPAPLSGQGCRRSCRRARRRRAARSHRAGPKP